MKQKSALGKLGIAVSVAALGGTLAAGASAASGASSVGHARGKAVKKNYTIALSDSYIGNAWRKAMVAAWTQTAKQAEAKGYIKSYRVDIASENTASAQISQIDSLILAHVNAIDIDSASPTALNSAITKACNAGIKVVVFDSLASAPCEYNLSDPFALWGGDLAKTVVTALHGHGNVILVQGVVGSQPNAVAIAAQKKVLAKYPGIHVVATVDGGAADSTTESAVAAVLPSLGKVQGVIAQEGVAGAIAAFKAAGRPIPAVPFSTDGQSLRIWAGLLKKDPSFTASALNTDPGQGSAALWESVLLLEGQKVRGKPIPHNLSWPLINVTRSTLQSWLKVTSPTAVTTYLWTLDQVQAGIGDNLAHKPVPVPSIPKKPV